MRVLVLILVLFPAVIQASCTEAADPDYALAVGRDDYAKAFELVARELHLTSEEKNHFKIVRGYSLTHDDRHGQADPDSLDLFLDPGLFLEGKEGACQGMMHELTHLRQFERDHARLHVYYSTHPVSERGWKGCDHEKLSGHADQAEEDAYDCLQDDALVSHAAAMEVEAVLAQIPFAVHGSLRDEDADYLTDHLTQWAAHQTMITDPANESYYLPEIKKADIQIFCRGADYARRMLTDPPSLTFARQFFCRSNR